jgi:predicted secreted hydrolase
MSVVTSDSSSVPVSYHAGSPDFALEVRDGDYHNFATGYDGDDHIGARLGGYVLDLSVTALKAPALHGEGGRVSLPVGYDVYYSRTRLSAEGTLTLGDRVETVTGMAWSEHQYGVNPTVTWEWFSIQLDDGRDLMVYARRTPGWPTETVDVTLVEADCGQRTFQASDVRVTRLASWTSPDTGVEYGSSWQIDLPADELNLTVTPHLRGAEILPSAASDIPYVYADCDVTGTQRGQPLNGLGFLEQNAS